LGLRVRVKLWLGTYDVSGGYSEGSVRVGVELELGKGKVRLCLGLGLYKRLEQIS